MLLKYFLSLVFVLTLSLSSYAQGFHYGFKGGIASDRIITNQSRIKGSGFGYGNTKFAIGFNVNVLIEYQSTGKFGFSAEPGFTRKGLPVGSTLTSGLNYLQLPLLLDYHLSEKMAVSIGSDFDYRLKTDRQFSSTRKKLEFGGIIAFRYSLDNHIDLGIRYGQSLAPIFSYELTDFEGNSLSPKLKLFNQYYQLNVGYKI